MGGVQLRVLRRVAGRTLARRPGRRRGRRHEVPLENENDDDPPRQHADHTAPAPDQITQQVELEDALDRAIAALPEKQRMAVILRRHEEMPYEQICEILRMSLPALKSLLFRARNELREIDAVATKHAQRYAIVPLLTEEPVGVERLRALANWRVS